MPKNMSRNKNEIVNKRLDVFPTIDMLELSDKSDFFRFKNFSVYPSLSFLIPSGNTDFKDNNAIQNALVFKCSINPMVNAEMLKPIKPSTILVPFICKG